MMSRNHVYFFVLVFVLMGVFGLAFRVQRVEAQPVIYYIRADGSIEPFTTFIFSADNITYTFTNNITGSILVQRSNIMIDGSGYTLQGYGGLYNENGFDLFNVNNVTIKDTIVESFYWGFLLNSTAHIVLSGNNITKNQQDGIVSLVSSNNIILGNNITNNSLHGIRLDGSLNNSIVGNNITNNNMPGIWLNGSSNNIVVGNNIAYNLWRGILLDGSLNNSIVGNNITNNEYGILLQNSSNNIIEGNNIANNPYGIRVHTSSNSNSIVGNNIANNILYGILLFYSSNNIVSGNNIANNSIDGICLRTSSNSNSIVGNNIANNGYGINLYSSDNLFYHNNFLNNTVQVYLTPGYANVWDDGYPSCGNYWSNYTGVDSNHDGIGDTAYIIAENNTDNFPLMGMFHSFNAFLGYDVYVISNSTIESFEYFESNSTIRMHVSNSSATQTYGFCRVCIPHDLMTEPYNVTINGKTPTYWNYTIYDNGTHRWIYFAYEHSTLEILIVPEFPSFLILPLFMIATLLAVIVHGRKHTM